MPEVPLPQGEAADQPLLSEQSAFPLLATVSCFVSSLLAHLPPNISWFLATAFQSK